MKKIVLAAVLVLLGSLVLPLFPQSAAADGYATVVTNEASDVDYFWATLNGQVTWIYGGTSVSEYAFVWSPVSHPDPGNTVPWDTAYVYDDGGNEFYWSDVHTTPFAWTYGEVGTNAGAYLRPNTAYYYRAAVHEMPSDQWVYANEMELDMPVNPEGTWPLYGYIYNTYVTVSTENITTSGLDMVALEGSVTWFDPDHTQAMCGDGFVWDTQSHANPSGWPDTWSDVDPTTCDYPNFVTPYTSLWDGSYAPYFTFTYLLGGLDPDVTYYYRAVGNLIGGGDWVYGPELSFTTGGCCTSQDSLNSRPRTGEVWYDFDPLSSDIWGAVNVAPGWFPSYTMSTGKTSFKPLAYSLPNLTPPPAPAWTPDHITVNTVSMLLYRIGTVNTLYVDVYLADEYTWYPVGLPLASGTADVSSLTTDPGGEWITVSLNADVTMDQPNVYDVVVYSDGYFDYPDDQNCVIWVSTNNPGEFRYMDSYDDGSDWYWPSYDACYILWDCEGVGTPAASLFEAWGYTPSTKPLWYQAWPSILKVLYLGAVILAAVFAYRQQPRPQYPDMPDMPDMGTGP